MIFSFIVVFISFVFEQNISIMWFNELIEHQALLFLS